MRGVFCLTTPGREMQNPITWASTTKWFQEVAQEVAHKADEIRQTRLVADLKTTGKSLLHNIVTTVAGGYDDEFLRLVKMQYITARTIAMPFPEPVDTIASVLAARHPNHYMIWNISEETYDAQKFNNQVLEYKFPGHPAPPLGVLVKMCTSIENWLKVDSQNVAVVHCLTGKGRTATVLAAALCWMRWDVGQPHGQDPTTLQALEFVAEQMGLDIDKVTIPSQRRYLQYANHIFDGIKPRSEPLLLRRVIMNRIPRIGEAPRGNSPMPTDDSAGDNGPQLGCCPYVQLFKGGNLVCTTPCSRDGSTAGTAQVSSDGVTVLPWAFPADGSIIFAVNCVVQGDILIRARHLTPSGQKVSMFRAAFHTGFMSGVMRLTKAQLDGACSDDRFAEDFFIDLIFAPASADAAKPPSTSPEGGQESKEHIDRPAAAEVDDYDAMLHQDVQFWKAIAARKRRTTNVVSQAPKFSISGDTEGHKDGVELEHNASRLQAKSPHHGHDAAASGTDTPALSLSSSSHHNRISNDDLLQELQALETMDRPTPPPAPLPSSGAEESVTASGSTSTVDVSRLNALEELEAELGITSPTAPAHVTGHSPQPQQHQRPEPASAASVDLGLDLDENLDELESYLQGLGK